MFANDPDQITPGSLQHAGDNVAALVVALGNSPLLGSPPTDDDDSLVFFDVLGAVGFVYSIWSQMALRCTYFGSLLHAHAAGIPLVPP